MLKLSLTALVLPLLFFFRSASENRATQSQPPRGSAQTETIEKLIVASGGTTIDVDLNRFKDRRTTHEEPQVETVRFTFAPDSFFSLLVSNGVLRTALPGSIKFIPQSSANLPPLLNASLPQLSLEKLRTGEAHDLVVRDSRNGFIFFYVQGHHYDYEAGTRSFTINDGRLIISDQFAKLLGLSAEALVVGTISLTATTQPIEIQTLVNGEIQSAIMPPTYGSANSTKPNNTNAVTLVQGPDVIVGELISVEQPSGGSSGSFVGLGVGTTSCNNGNQPINWFGLPSNDHPVIPQNLYRMSGGTNNTERFEQIGQSWLKHGFTALSDDECGFGCNTTGCTAGSHLCPGCSDAYSANLNYTQSFLGSRAWVNPFTGFYPAGGSPQFTVRDHTGHAHSGTSHRVTVAMSDLTTAGATYFAEAQYVAPHEYDWCQSNPGQCNQYNNVSYRRFDVSGTTSFTFSPVGSTVRTQPAINAWTGATINQIEPDPGVDGIGLVAYKVTNPSAGLWHYEYAVYNENLDRAIQAFTVPLGAGTSISNIGFHAPPQEPGWAADGTTGNTGFSNAIWSTTQTSSSLTWNTESFATNPNANAIRWSTLYNFRFDADSPPQTVNATIGFFKTGSPITVAIQGPSALTTPTPTPFNISGTISYCLSPNLNPVPDVTVSLTGDAAGSAMSDGSGNYTLMAVPPGGNYIVTPSKAPLMPDTTGINTVDVIAVQRHFLSIAPFPPGCALTAADVNGDSNVDTLDVIAIQRFALGFSAGIANVGKYSFDPASRSYSPLTGNQTGQDYNALIFGDVAAGFVH